MATNETASTSATGAENGLNSEKARRIVEAMRQCIGKLGPVNSTFDVVAKEAGVSRGLLHYYFGTKERLMIEVLRVDAQERIDAIHALAPQIKTAEDIMNLFLTHLQEWLAVSPDSYALIYEMIGEARRNDEIGTANRAMWHRVENEVAALLQRVQDEGAIQMRGSAKACALAILAMGHGLAMVILAEPDADHSEMTDRIIEAANYVLGQESPSARGATA